MLRVQGIGLSYTKLENPFIGMVKSSWPDKLGLQAVYEPFCAEFGLNSARLWSQILHAVQKFVLSKSKSMFHFKGEQYSARYFICSVVLNNRNLEGNHSFYDLFRFFLFAMASDMVPYSPIKSPNREGKVFRNGSPTHPPLLPGCSRLLCPELLSFCKIF